MSGKFGNTPNLIRNSSRHCGRDPEGVVDPAKNYRDRSGDANAAFKLSHLRENAYVSLVSRLRH
jgi:hypothetical protein